RRSLLFRQPQRHDRAKRERGSVNDRFCQGCGVNGSLNIRFTSFSFSQNVSIRSESGSRFTGTLAVHGFTYAFGSLIVMSMSMLPMLRRVKRSVTCATSGCGVHAA